MPSLSVQIGVLYKTIGQLEQGSGPRGTAPRPARLGASGRWLYSFYCLWFSLPLSIWLSTGSIGLLLYWQALSAAACLLEKFSLKQRPASALVAAGPTADYCPAQEAAQ